MTNWLMKIIIVYGIPVVVKLKIICEIYKQLFNLFSPDLMCQVTNKLISELMIPMPVPASNSHKFL